ncbi:MAG: hypothetical protein Kow00105_01640 [Phycisphaeraceae bacterium]
MATSFGALCTDFYINQKLTLKMDLPSERETLLHFFDQVRKAWPSMSRFRRYEGELSLESSRQDAEYTWLSLQRSSIRTGHVNPETMESAYRFHRKVLEIAPYFLTISPLDVDYVELLFGFDIECKGNHDEVVYEALYADSQLGHLLKPSGAAAGSKILDVQPVFGIDLSEDGRVQAYFEVKTRRRSRRGSGRRYAQEPISLYITLRDYGPVDKLEDLQTVTRDLSARAEALATERLIPHMLNPIVQHISPSSR